MNIFLTLFFLILLFILFQGTFQDFDIEALKYFERLVLEKLYFAISPQVTPYAFIRKLLLIWEPENENTELVKIADTLVSDFWEGKN